MLRTINSFNMSFCIVPDSFSCDTPYRGTKLARRVQETRQTCSSAATMYMARTGSTAPFIVMETDMVSSGISSNKICTCNKECTCKMANFSYFHVFNRINGYSSHTNVSHGNRVVGIVTIATNDATRQEEMCLTLYEWASQRLH